MIISILASDTILRCANIVVQRYASYLSDPDHLRSMQPKRKSQRKRDYDYSQPGYYAVTVCTQNRSCLFGVIDNGDMLLNDAGRMIIETWDETPDYYPDIGLDVMQVMPNHLHGVIVVREVGADLCVRPLPGIENGQTQRSVPTTLSNVIKRFKTITANVILTVSATMVGIHSPANCGNAAIMTESYVTKRN